MNSRPSWILWVAQGFGVGRIPVAPGTWGSLAGLGWFALLLLTGSVWLFAGAVVVGMAASVWICGAAEKILGETDPGSVVLDEIVALPLCFAWWVGLASYRSGSLPPPGFFFSGHTWPLTFGIFMAFRLFDVWKPWPVRQSQRLPGGWGVTIDDVLAALYVNVVAIILSSLPAIASMTVSSPSP